MPEYRVRVLTGLLIALLVRSAAADGDGPPQLRAVLRADWSQPSSSTWDGKIRVSEGNVEFVHVLQLSVGQVDILPSGDDKEIHFRSDGPTVWAGVEFTINAPAHNRSTLNQAFPSSRSPSRSYTMTATSPVTSR